MELTKIGKFLHVPKYSRFESVCARILFAYFVYLSMPLDLNSNFEAKLYANKKISPYVKCLKPEGRLNFDMQKYPVSIAKFVDLRFIAKPKMQKFLWSAVILSLVLYVWGRGCVFSLSVLVVISIVNYTLKNSQGFIFHKYQVLSMILLVQCLLAWYFFVFRRKDSSQLNAYFMRFSQMVIIGFYMTSVCSKWDSSKGKWFAKGQNIAFSIVKTNRQTYYNHLNREGIDEKINLAKTLLKYAIFTNLAINLGFLLEFFCFLALLNKKLSLIIGLLFVTFHQSVTAIMNLNFPVNEQMIWIYLINVPFWLVIVKNLLTRVK